MNICITFEYSPQTTTELAELPQWCCHFFHPCLIVPTGCFHLTHLTYSISKVWINYYKVLKIRADFSNSQKFMDNYKLSRRQLQKSNSSWILAFVMSMDTWKRPVPLVFKNSAVTIIDSPYRDVRNSKGILTASSIASR